MIGTVLTSYGEVVHAASAVRDLIRRANLQDDISLRPEFFLGSLSSERMPRVVVVDDGKSPRGVVFSIEIAYLGIPTGFITGGWAGSGLVACDPSDFYPVLNIALHALLGFRQRIHAIRWTIPWSSGGMPDGAAIKLIDGAVNMSAMRPSPDQLLLSDTYDGFLSRLGDHTRRNFRYYRRKVEEQQISYVPDMTAAMFNAELGRLARRSKFRYSARKVRREQRLLDCVGGSFRKGLQTQFGNFVSLAAGWRHDRTMTILTQANDRSLAKLSLSVVLRGYMIEEAIRSGVEKICFLHECLGLLRPHCEARFVRDIYYDGKQLAPHLVRSLGSGLQPYLRRIGLTPYLLDRFLHNGV